MTTIDTNWIAAHVRRPANANMRSIISGLQAYPAGLEQPIRFACYLGQLDLESGSFIYDREIWGSKPTAAQARYEGRKDLGNTLPGDGFKFRGRTAIQITGRANTTAFRDWCLTLNPACPDFVQDPDLINTDPWEGLGPIWYWTTHRLNDWADRADVHEITHRINGGYNGLADRIRWTDAAMVKLSGESDVRAFQRSHALVPDGVIGPITRGTLFSAMRMLPDLQFAV